MSNENICHFRVMPLGVTLKSFKDALKYLAVVLYPNNRYEQQLLLLDRVLKANRMSVFDLFELTTPKCDDFVVMCQFEGKVKDCHKIISTSLTSHGLCCSYNYGYAMNERRWKRFPYFSFFPSLLLVHFTILHCLSGLADRNWLNYRKY